MPRIVLARDRQHEQVEFPDDIPKSESRRGGSLHLRRGIVRDVTKEELAYIEVNHPEIFACLDLLPEPNVPAITLKRQKAQGADKVKSRRALLEQKKASSEKVEVAKKKVAKEPEPETKPSEKSEESSKRFGTSRSKKPRGGN